MLALIMSAPLAWAGSGSAGIPVNDTTIFSFFVLCAIIFMMVIYAQINAVKSILENRDLWLSDGKKKSGAKEAGVAIVALMLSQGL